MVLWLFIVTVASHLQLLQVKDFQRYLKTIERKYDQSHLRKKIKLHDKNVKTVCGNFSLFRYS